MFPRYSLGHGLNTANDMITGAASASKKKLFTSFKEKKYLNY